VRNARRHLAVVALSCALASLAGCTGSAPGSCEPGGTAVVTATGPDGRTWQRTTDVTIEPPSVANGYVLVRHPCSWTALDLQDGRVVREGDGKAAGVAGGWVYTYSDDGETVSGEPVEEGRGAGEFDRRDLVTPGQQQQAYTVGEHLYVLPRDDGPVGVTQYAGGGDEQWTVSLPVAREPTLTPVGEVLVVTSADGSVYGIDTQLGTMMWRTLAPTSATTYVLRARARHDDEVVLTVWDAPDSVDAAGTVVVLDAATGERLDRSARPDPGEPDLTASSDGWRVDVEADPLWAMD
jgi:outer membrane protein assembly factor BamB